MVTSAPLALQVSLMEENGSTRDDLKLPTGTEEADKLAIQLKEEFSQGKEIIVTVLKVSVQKACKWDLRCSCANSGNGTAMPSLRSCVSPRRPWVTR
jgi:hypothetical protein